MPNPNKRKGDDAERAARDWYRVNGFPHTEKTRAGYTRDAGDLHLCPGAITQVKNCRTLRWTEWFQQLAQQRAEAKADVAWLTVKRPGMGEHHTGQWLAVMTLQEFTNLLRAAGYGTPPDTDGTEALHNGSPASSPHPEPVRPSDGHRATENKAPNAASPPATKGDAA